MSKNLFIQLIIGGTSKRYWRTHTIVLINAKLVNIIKYNFCILISLWDDMPLPFYGQDCLCYCGQEERALLLVFCKV